MLSFLSAGFIAYPLNFSKVPGVAAELETVSFRSDSTFISSNPTSLASYKTERSINSRKSRYNALPQRKYAGIGQFSQDLVSEDVDDASVPKVCRTISRLVKTTLAPLFRIIAHFQGC